MEPQNNRKVLASDLDGTLIPLDGDAANRADLKILAQQLVDQKIPLLFVTGRHLESVQGAMEHYRLPKPHWLICDVGTSLYTCDADSQFQLVSAYHDHQLEVTSGFEAACLRERLSSIDGLRLQEEEKQGRFKLSYYTDSADLDRLVAEVESRLGEESLPFSIISSIDPFNDDGLLDILPSGVSKAYALNWWSLEYGHAADQIVYAGDSGNDFAALTANFCAILVGNADRQLAARIQAARDRCGTSHQLFLAKNHATSGVLEGVRWFGLI